MPRTDVSSCSRYSSMREALVDCCVLRKPSNKPFEWTGRHELSASPPQAPCLPLKGSVRLSRVSAPRSMPEPIRLKLHFSLYAPNQNPGEELAIYRPYVIFASNWDSPDSGIATIFPLASGIPLPDSIHVLANSGGAAGALKAARETLLALPENQGLATLPANLDTFSEF